MFGVDFVLFCCAVGGVLARISWVAGGITARRRRRGPAVDVLSEAIGVVERYEAQLRRQTSHGEGP